MRVSVIIPSYNVGGLIERCLDSVHLQRTSIGELIVIDDGSTDDTAARVEARVAPNALPITLVRQANAGASAARNVGLLHAKHEYIQFLDADDELLAGKLDHQMDLAAQCGHPDLIVGAGTYIDPQGGWRGPTRSGSDHSDVWLALMSHGMSVTSCNLWKREAVLAAGGWDETLGSSQEYDLMFRMLRNGARVVFDDKVLTHVHQRPGASISHTNRSANWRRYVELRGRIVEHLRSLNDGRDMRPYLQVLFDNIRVLYDLDPKAALELHERLIPADFRPERSPTSGTAYIAMHRMLGFAAAQRVRHWTSRGN